MFSSSNRIMVHWQFVLIGILMLTRNVQSMATKTSGKRLVFHWFRNGDLRVHDNPALIHSIKSSDICVPVFCFDSKVFGDDAQTPFGSLKCGPKRAKFILESVIDLKDQLDNIGGSLLVARGDPVDVFDGIFKDLKGTSYDVAVVLQEEPLKEEQDAAKSVGAALKKHFPQAKLESIWGSTMYDLKDLPFDAHLSDLPNGFTPFRNKVEKNCEIQNPLLTPRKLVLPESGSNEFQVISPRLGYMPTLKDLGYTDSQIQLASTFDARGVMDFHGGENAALARVKEYIWDKDLLRAYFDTRNGMIGADYSSKFSPWLAHGCVSPRMIAMECRKYEEQVVANKSTYWLVFEMLWRDYCKFFCVKHGNKVFFPGGTIDSDKKWSTFEKSFRAWKEGRTGYPLVDANMREMNATGFMSNRGRQNVCSFLAIDLNYDWRFGADWFESNLLDYDVYSNWVNWAAGAGVTGGRLNRFNIVKQSKDYDQHGEYVRRWLPELKDVPTKFVHEPWKMTQFEQVESGVTLGVDYPNPIVPPSRPRNNNDPPSKSRKANSSDRNRHQKYEMKSLKQGDFKFR